MGSYEHHEPGWNVRDSRNHFSHLQDRDTNAYPIRVPIYFIILLFIIRVTYKLYCVKCMQSTYLSAWHSGSTVYYNRVCDDAKRCREGLARSDSNWTNFLWEVTSGFKKAW